MHTPPLAPHTASTPCASTAAKSNHKTACLEQTALQERCFAFDLAACLVLCSLCWRHVCWAHVFLRPRVPCCELLAAWCAVNHMWAGRVPRRSDQAMCTSCTA
eukprot:307883-Rhodomonas_salina.1